MWGLPNPGVDQGFFFCSNSLSNVQILVAFQNLLVILSELAYCWMKFAGHMQLNRTPCSVTMQQDFQRLQMR